MRKWTRVSFFISQQPQARKAPDAESLSCNWLKTHNRLAEKSKANWGDPNLSVIKWWCCYSKQFTTTAPPQTKRSPLRSSKEETVATEPLPSPAPCCVLPQPPSAGSRERERPERGRSTSWRGGQARDHLASSACKQKKAGTRHCHSRPCLRLPDSALWERRAESARSAQPQSWIELRERGKAGLSWVLGDCQQASVRAWASWASSASLDWRWQAAQQGFLARGCPGQIVLRSRDAQRAALARSLLSQLFVLLLLPMWNIPFFSLLSIYLLSSYTFLNGLPTRGGGDYKHVNAIKG